MVDLLDNFLNSLKVFLAFASDLASNHSEEPSASYSRFQEIIGTASSIFSHFQHFQPFSAIFSSCLVLAVLSRLTCLKISLPKIRLVVIKVDLEDAVGSCSDSGINMTYVPMYMT
jgi:hypothetical protein